VFGGSNATLPSYRAINNMHGELAEIGKVSSLPRVHPPPLSLLSKNSNHHYNQARDYVKGYNKYRSRKDATFCTLGDYDSAFKIKMPFKD
jgi:hypothetical protein